MDSIYVTALRITCILMVIRWADCLNPPNDEFNEKHYAGRRVRAVIVVYNKSNRTRPLCYGVLISWNKAVVPCSCVTVPVDPRQAGTPWYHPDYPGGTAIRPALSNLEIGLMAEEHNAIAHAVRISLQEIKKHSRCDAMYTVNFAVLTLRSNVDRARLAWVNSASKIVLNYEILQATKSSATFGQCKIVQWVNDAKINVRYEGKYYKFVTEAGPPKWAVKSIRVQFEHWLSCLPNVCPRYKPPSVHTVKRRGDYCYNYVKASRWCLGWSGGTTGRLCDVLEGTPVFCNMGDRGGEGVVGLLFSKTTLCMETPKAVVAGFDEALDLVRKDLPLMRLKNYLKNEQIRIDAVHQVKGRNKGSSTHAALKSVSIISIFAYLFLLF